MAFGETPSWLNPPDFIGAAARGASLGLQGRQQDIEQSSAADRLRLAYDTLAQHEKMQNRAAMQQLQLGQAANAIRSAHEQALQEHYAAMKDAEDKQTMVLNAAAALKEKREQDIAEHYKTESERKANAPVSAGGRLWKINPDGTSTALTQSPDKFMDIGGVLYKIPGDGTDPVPVNQKDKTTKNPYRFTDKNGNHYEQYPGEPAKLIQMPGVSSGESSDNTSSILPAAVRLSAAGLSLNPLTGGIGTAPLTALASMYSDSLKTPPSPLTNSLPAVGQSFAPQETQAAPTPSLKSSGDVAQRAHAAIAAGADEKAVRQRYKKLTGQDLD